MRKKRGRECFIFCFFASALKISFDLRSVRSYGGSTLMEVPCTIKQLSVEKQSPRDRIDKEEMGNGKKTGAFPSPLCFKLDKSLTPGSRMLL